jgi:hypothetical protein
VSLPAFLGGHEVGTLSIENRRLIVQRALLLLEQNYALRRSRSRGAGSTRCTLPRPFAAAAFLPLLLKEFTEDGRRRYLVGKHRPEDAELPHPTFRFGVEVTQWNGVPIARAIERFAERIPGANPDARHARAVDRFSSVPSASGRRRTRSCSPSSTSISRAGTARSS